MEKSVQKLVVVHDDRVYRAINRHSRFMKKHLLVTLVVAACTVYTIKRIDKLEKAVKEKTEGEK